MDERIGDRGTTPMACHRTIHGSIAMSWTSESEPQVHTTEEGDAPVAETNDTDNGSSPPVVGVEVSDDDGPPAAADPRTGGGGSDIEDDGPLDPSLFFGLFDDLGGDRDIESVAATEPAPAGDSDAGNDVEADGSALFSDDSVPDVDDSAPYDEGTPGIEGAAPVEPEFTLTIDDPSIAEPKPGGETLDHSGVGVADGEASDALFGVLEELLESEPSGDGGDDRFATDDEGEHDTPIADQGENETPIADQGEHETPIIADQDDEENDVVILGGALPPGATTDLDTGSLSAGRELFDDGVLENIGFDDPDPEPADVGIQVNDLAVTIEPMVESGIRQPVVSPPKVFSRASDDRSSTRAPVDEPRPPTGTGESVAGPGLGVVLAAVLLTLVVALIAAVAVLSGNGGSGTEAAEGTEPAAPADGADAAIDQDLQQVGDDNPVAGQRAGAQETAGAQNTAQNTAGPQNTASPAVAALARELAEGRVDLTSIRFVPGTVEPTESGRRLIEELAEAVLVSGGQPVSVVVRTYSEAGSADNQALSEAQAEALVQLLVAEGVPADQVVAVGQGSGPLSLQQPVPDFIVVNPELGDAVFKRVIADIGTFTLGSRPGGTESGQSGELRLESLAVVDGVGQALVNFEDSTIGLAGYSYFEADNESNRAQAGRASDAVARRLAEVHGIGPDRVTIITPGAAPYVVRPEVGNHIWIRAGARTITAFEVAAIDAAAIDFDAGSPAPSAASGAILDQLAAALAASTDTLVIDVRTYSEATGAANMELSQARADAIAAYLVEDGGIEAGRLRAFGSGASSYFADDGGSHVTLTVIP